MIEGNIDFPKVLMIGGPDVDGRIPLIKRLEGQFSVSVLGSNPSLSTIFTQAGITYSSYHLDRGSNPFSDLGTFWQLKNIIHTIRPDIVHTFDTKPAVWGRLAASSADGAVVIGTLPGLGSLYSQDNIRSKVIRTIYQPLQKWACHSSALTMFQNSEDMKQFLNVGIVQENKAVVFPGSGVDTKIFDPQRYSVEKRLAIRTKLNITEQQVVVTMISRLIRSKGVLEFSRAAEAIRAKFPQAVFLFIGTYDHENLDAITESEYHQLENTVTCLGSRNDVPDLLAISDIFVLPTYYREGIPRVLLEAASMGLPLVATDVPGCREVIQSGINGYLVSPRDASSLAEGITKLMRDSEIRHRFGENSRQHVINHFDLAIVAEQTVSIYRKLLTSQSKI
jgi:glycosyltransferase involved in cell wall biosynthesis